MRERIRDSLPRRSSPSRTTGGDGNESRRYKRRNVPSRSGQSPVQVDRDSRGFEIIRTDREQCVDGIRRECGCSSPYEVERQIRGGFSDMDRREEDRDNGRHMKHYHLQKHALISGDDYPNRSDPTETVYHGSGGGLGLIRSAEETYRRRDTESFRSTMNQCLSDEPEPSKFTTPRDYTNVLRNDEIERLESNSRGYSDSCLHRLNPYRKSEQGQTEAIFVATKGEHYSDDGRDRDTYKIQESSPLSQIGSSVVDSQDESSRRCVRCASQVLQSRDLEDHVGRNSSREKGKYFLDVSYSQDFGCGGHDSPAMSRCGKEIVDESRQNYQIGYDIAVREFPSVRHDVKNMGRETDVLMQTGGYGSNRDDVDATDTNLEFNTRERITDQYGFVKEHYPLVELESHVVNEREDKTHHYRDVRYDEQREVVSSKNKFQLLRKDYQYDGVDGRMYLDFRGTYAMVDDKAPHSTTLCLNKEREAYLENERKPAYSENRKQELRNEYHFGNDGRIHSHVHGEDIVVDRDGRVLQLQQVCLNKGDIVVDRDGRVVQLQQEFLNKGSERDYDSGSGARIYRDVNRLDIAVDREDARGLRYRGVSINDTKEAYLQSESHQLLKYHETGSYGMMHPNVNKPFILVDREEARGLRNRGVSANDIEEAYLQCESQKLLKDRETDSYSYGMTHSDVNKSYIRVDREDAGVRRHRGVSLNDRKEAYLQCERQQLLKDRETNSYGMMHPDVNKSYIQVDREDARALERIAVSFSDGNESYLDNGRRDAYLRYESQQLKKDYDYGNDDRIYGDVNSSYIGLDQGNAKALEPRRGSFNDGNEANNRDVYMHYKIPQPQKDYDSGINAGMYHDVNRSEIVVDQEFASALELRREAYLHYENKQLLKDHESDAYGVMHPDVSRSSARKQDEEALGRRRYPLDDDRNQVYLNDDERLQLRNGGHVKVHANRRYSEMLLARDEYGLRDEAAGEVIHENVADDYNNYGDIKLSGMCYEKVDRSGRFHDHGYRDKLRNYEVEGGRSMKQFRDLVDERRFRNDQHQDSTLRPRISAKDRLGGRVGDSGVLVRNRGLHRVRNSNLKGKAHNRRKEVAFSQHGQTHTHKKRIGEKFQKNLRLGGFEVGI